MVKILVDGSGNYPLGAEDIKYVFKTLFTIAGIPWHFMPQETGEPVDIYFGRTRRLNCRLFIEMADINRDGAEMPDDMVFSSFRLLSGRYNDAAGDRLKPLINEYALSLRDTFGESYGYVPMWPFNKKYAVALSHDVDYPNMIRWAEALRYAAGYKLRSRPRKIMDILKGRESFWRFEDWANLEERHNIKSAFYFCGLRGSLTRRLFTAPDPFYDVAGDSFKRILRLLDQKGFEVGMHGSYLAYRSADGFRKEKNRVEDALGGSIYGNRHHCWHMDPHDPSRTALIHERIGLTYDSSVAFADKIGYRYGICSPFHMYDSAGRRAVTTLELPVALMDRYLFGRARRGNPAGYRAEIDSLLDSVKKYEGLLVADYHVRVFNDTFFPRWAESYGYLLKRLAESDDFYCDTPIGIAKHWLDREKRIFEKSKDEHCRTYE